MHHATPPSDSDASRRRAHYRATHRGTKEMDWLLGKYAEAKLPAMDENQLTQFEKFISLPDPDLNAWLLNPTRIAGLEFAPLVADIRAFHDLRDTLDQPMTGTER